MLGVEGGVGYGPERLNLGMEHRDGKLFGYVEIDPWLLVGASLGLGIDADGVPHPMIGGWEAVPIRLEDVPCYSDHYVKELTIAGGLRYTSIVELYVTVTAGGAQPVCPFGE